MRLKLYRAASILFCAFSLFSLTEDGRVGAQQTGTLGTPNDMRSAAFAPSFEESLSQSLDEFHEKNDILLSNEELSELQINHRDDYGHDEQLLSLDLFHSLADYLRNLPYDQQSRLDNILTNAAPMSGLYPKAALLGALEFYSHLPLRRIDVEAGLARLNGLHDSGISASSIQSEIHFWKAEGYNAIGEFDIAEREYRSTIARQGFPRLLALADFRLAELLERERKYAAADTAFAEASLMRESPLMLLSLLRLGAVERSEKNYEAVLLTMDRADSLFHATEHSFRASARDVHFTSTLIGELLRRNEQFADSSFQLISPFYLSEIALLRGSAESGLARYDTATEILAKGERLIDSEESKADEPDSANLDARISSASISEQANFIADALKFELAWSLFERAKYREAAGAFLQLTVADTGETRHRILRESIPGLREQGFYFDPFLDYPASGLQSQAVDGSVLSKSEIDTSFFIYNDFPERSRYYAGVALARTGMLGEAADVLERLVADKAALYSNAASYELALIRFKQHNYASEELLEPLSYEQSPRGGFASFLLGELAYRKNFYERAEGYFQNSFANLPKQDTAILATAHLERGLSLIPLDNWKEAANELTKYHLMSHESIPGQTDEALFWLGKAYFRAGEFDSAKFTFSRLLSEFPKSERIIDASYSYAWSLFQMNEFKSAELAFEKIIALDSISRYAYDALARAGDSYYALDEVKRSNMLYNLAVDRPAFNDFRTTRALLMLGITRMKLDSDRSAMNQFKYLAAKFPKSDIVDLAYFNSALAAYSINLSGDAEETIDRLVSKYRRSAVAPRALYVAGEERVRRGEENGSLSYYEQVLKEYPRSREAGLSLFALQDALADLNRIPEALAVADTFVQNNPGNPIIPMVLLRAGQFKMKMRQPGGAIANFRQFLAEYPTDPARPRAELLLAQSELESGDTATALSQIDTVISKYYSLDVSSEAYLERARVEEKRKDFDVAALDFHSAFQDKYYSSDGSPEAMFEFAEMLAFEKNIDSAIDAFSDVATRYPIEASIVARAELRAGELLASERKWNDARGAYARVIAAHSKDLFGGVATEMTAETYIRDADWKKAAQTFADAKDHFTLSRETESRVLLGLAKADSHLGKKSEAVHNLKSLLALRGVPPSERFEADSLLHILQPVEKKPPAKKTRKKGGKRQ